MRSVCLCSEVGFGNGVGVLCGKDVKEFDLWWVVLDVGCACEVK